MLLFSYLAVTVYLYYKTDKTQAAYTQFCSLTDQLTKSLISYEKAKQALYLSKDFSFYAGEALRNIQKLADILSSSDAIPLILVEKGFKFTQLMATSLETQRNFVDSYEVFHEFEGIFE